ncbi:MAG: biotin--[acetyl-CoA-carboxylase] ligase, partial [Anaerolineae bacterium]
DPTTVPGIPQTATSLREELGREVAREPLLQSWLERMEKGFLRLDHESLNEDWSARLATLGQEVSVNTPGGRVSGLAERVDADGTLMVRRKDGTVVGVTVGEVS